MWTKYLSKCLIDGFIWKVCDVVSCSLCPRRTKLKPKVSPSTYIKLDKIKINQTQKATGSRKIETQCIFGRM